MFQGSVMTVTLTMMSLISLAWASTVVRKEAATTVLYDASSEGGLNNYGGCYEADVTYINECLLKSNYVQYHLSREPTTATGTCSQFGYNTEVSMKVWNGGKFFWSTQKAGGLTFQEWNTIFYGNHPLLNEQYLKDGNPACNGGIVVDRSHESLAPFDGGFISLYDESPLEQQNYQLCIEGTAPYMKQCAISDPFAYVLFTKARATSMSCDEVGKKYFNGRLQYVTYDLLFPGFNQTWVDGKQGAGLVDAAYNKAHPNTGKMIGYNGLQNPTCLSAHCNTPPLASRECNQSTPEWATYDSKVRFPDRSIKASWSVGSDGASKDFKDGAMAGAVVGSALGTVVGAAAGSSIR